MKILIKNYTFDASAKTITFDDYTTIRLDNVLLITNVTDNVLIYQFNKPTKGGTVATNVLTLTFDTTAMADTDDLQIFYDDVDLEPALENGGNLTKRYGGGKQPFSQRFSTVGNHDCITPAAGNFIRIFWVAFVPNPDSDANLVTFGFGTAGGAIEDEVYGAYFLQHWEVFDGAVDKSVIINLNANVSVGIMVHYEEITP